MPDQRDDRSLGELFAELTRETRTLIQQEFELARSELTTKTSELGKNAALIAAGGLMAYAGFLAVVAAVVLGLVALDLPPWAAALVGGALVAGVGYLLYRQGLATLRRTNIKPRQTIETLKEDAQWLKTQMR